MTYALYSPVENIDKKLQRQLMAFNGFFDPGEFRGGNRVSPCGKRLAEEAIISLTQQGAKFLFKVFQIITAAGGDVLDRIPYAFLGRIERDTIVLVVWSVGGSHCFNDDAESVGLLFEPLDVLVLSFDATDELNEIDGQSVCRADYCYHTRYKVIMYCQQAPSSNLRRLARDSNAGLY